MTPPTDFCRLSSEAGRVRVWVDPEWATTVRHLGLLESGGLERLLVESAKGPGRGRAATSLVRLPDRPERLHLRPLWHGGWLAPLLRDRWLGTRRPERELATAWRLHRAGAPVARTPLVCAERRGFFWRAAVGTLYEEHSLDVGRWLDTNPGPARIVAAARCLGRAVRRFHDAGGRHRDLHVGNLLLREHATGFDTWVIDLDRAGLGPAPTAAERFRELMRLVRSLRKTERLGQIGERGCAAFLSAYTGGDRALRRAMLARLPIERARLAIHELGRSTRRDPARAAEPPPPGGSTQ